MSTLITLALVVVMIGGLIGIFVCNKKMGTLPGAQGIAIGLLVLVIASGAGFLYRTGIIGPSEGEMIRTIEHRIYASQAYGLAKWMKENNTYSILCIWSLPLLRMISINIPLMIFT